MHDGEMQVHDLKYGMGERVEAEDNEQLNMLEDLSRCASVTVAGVESLMAGAERLVEMRALVKKYRPAPYRYEGGRRYRGGCGGRRSCSVVGRRTAWRGRTVASPRISCGRTRCSGCPATTIGRPGASCSRG
jgi:hypothetical protein